MSTTTTTALTLRFGATPGVGIDISELTGMSQLVQTIFEEIRYQNRDIMLRVLEAIQGRLKTLNSRYNNNLDNMVYKIAALVFFIEDDDSAATILRIYNHCTIFKETDPNKQLEKAVALAEIGGLVQFESIKRLFLAKLQPLLDSFHKSIQDFAGKSGQSVSPTLFIDLCRTSNKSAIRKALKMGADPNAVNEKGEHVLKFCLFLNLNKRERSVNSDILELLLDAGLQVNKPLQLKETPYPHKSYLCLHLTKTNPSTVGLLLGKGCLDVTTPIIKKIWKTRTALSAVLKSITRANMFVPAHVFCIVELFGYLNVKTTMDEERLLGLPHQGRQTFLIEKNGKKYRTPITESLWECFYRGVCTRQLIEYAIKHSLDIDYIDKARTNVSKWHALKSTPLNDLSANVVLSYLQPSEWLSQADFISLCKQERSNRKILNYCLEKYTFNVIIPENDDYDRRIESLLKHDVIPANL